MRSVHTAASVHSHWGGTSLPCLAFGTPGSCICSGVSFTRPPSCPPWLHGRYPLLRYYEDSDSCSAPSGTRTGILGSWACASRHSVSTHPMRPRSGYAFGSGQAWPPIRLGSYRRCFGLRSSLAVSSVAFGRIEFVSWVAIGPISSTDYLFTSSCSPPHLAVTQLLSVTGGKLHQRGTFTLLRTLIPKRTRAGILPASDRQHHYTWGWRARCPPYLFANPRSSTRATSPPDRPGSVATTIRYRRSQRGPWRRSWL